MQKRQDFSILACLKPKGQLFILNLLFINLTVKTPNVTNGRRVYIKPLQSRFGHLAQRFVLAVITSLKLFFCHTLHQKLHLCQQATFFVLFTASARTRFIPSHVLRINLRFGLFFFNIAQSVRKSLGFVQNSGRRKNLSL